MLASQLGELNWTGVETFSVEALSNALVQRKKKSSKRVVQLASQVSHELMLALEGDNKVDFIDYTRGRVIDIDAQYSPALYMFAFSSVRLSTSYEDWSKPTSTVDWDTLTDRMVEMYKEGHFVIPAFEDARQQYLLLRGNAEYTTDFDPLPQQDDDADDADGADDDEENTPGDRLNICAYVEETERHAVEDIYMQYSCFDEV